jgi:nucleotide-binding universal stress UspA family protein
MTTTLPILVAYDGSADAELALKWAAAESLRTGVPLRVLTVNPVLPPTWGGMTGGLGMAGTVDVPVSDSSAILEQAGKTLSEAGVSSVTLEQATGHVVNELLRAAESASSLVVGSHGHGRTGEVLIGSVSQHLARHAPCPVVVVRPARNPEARRIVVGVDGSRYSLAALDYACRRAEDTDETVVAIHAWRVHPRSTDVWSSEPRSIDIEERELLLAESVAGVREDHPDVRLEIVLVSFWD